MTRPALIGGHRPGHDTRDPFAGIADELQWAQHAACGGHWQEMEPGCRWDAALAIVRYCETCPVLQECRSLLDQQSRYATGIWAGRWLQEPKAGPRKRQHRPLPLGKARAFLAGLGPPEVST